MTKWFGPGEELADVSASDRGLQYGDGLFETIAIRKGEPRLWDFHVDRLVRGCKKLGINIPPAASLYDGVIHAVRENDVPSSYSVAKIIVSAGDALRGYGRQYVDAPSVLFAAFPSAPSPIESYRDGIEIGQCDIRLAVHSATAGLKTLNRLEQVLARSEIAKTGLFEGLTMDAEDNIICGTMSNVFVVLDGTIMTPTLQSNGVEGVMRRYIIETMAELDTNTAIRAIKLDELENMDEVFLCNSQFGVIPVRRCADKTWPVGEMTRHVMSVLAKQGISECRV